MTTPAATATADKELSASLIGRALPNGMKVWAGGDSAPEDWDPNSDMLFRDGMICIAGAGEPSWVHNSNEADIVAYTPKRANDIPTAEGLIDNARTQLGLQNRRMDPDTYDVALYALNVALSMGTPATGELATKLTGRARFLRARGEVKSPELMERAAEIVAAFYAVASPKPLHAWTGDGTRCQEDGYDGPICARCSRPDLPDTQTECKP
jgi:hypothetical protein